MLLGDLKAKQGLDKKIAEREVEILKNLEAKIQSGSTLVLTHEQFLNLQIEKELPTELRGMDMGIAEKICTGCQAGSLPVQTSLEARSDAAHNSQGNAKISAFFKAVRQEYTCHSKTLSKDQLQTWHHSSESAD